MSSRDPRETAASRRAHAPGRDPKDVVTEYAFQVDPDLLGVPLAGPFRRAAGILVDLMVLGLLFPIRAAAGALLGGVVDLLVAAAVAWVLWKMASPAGPGRTPSAGIRASLRVAAVIVLLAGAVPLLGGRDEGGEESRGPGDAPAAASTEETPAEVEAALSEAAEATGGEAGPGGGSLGRVLREEAGASGLSLGRVMRNVGEVRALSEAESAEEAQPVADRLALELHEMGVPPGDVADVLQEVMAGDDERAWVVEVARSAAARVDSVLRERESRSDSLVVRLGRAISAGDTAAADSLRGRVKEAVAGREIAELRRERNDLAGELEEARSTGSLIERGVDVVTDDLGIGLGWLGLYFTFFIALWRGRTPGKKLLGTRVVHLSGEPLGWWDAFGRFGGYAAGLATGMLGYFQIVWDPNRQALHDKVAGTVVIRTRGPGKRYRE
jgi:hypothetical protein